MSGPYKPTQREYAMENLNTQMDDQLKNRVAELNRTNDENRDGRLDAAAALRTVSFITILSLC